MATYLLLIPTDEDAWAASSNEEKATVYERHSEFNRLLAERGHKVVSAAELAPSSAARTVRPSGVTDGPYAEAHEQLSGFYVVDSDDLDDLVACVQVLAAVESGIEIRPFATE